MVNIWQVILSVGFVSATGGSSGSRKAHHHVAATGILPTTDFVAPEYFKCLNTVNGAFYFYDTLMMRDYVGGRIASSKVIPSREACEMLPALTQHYKTFQVTLQPDIGTLRFAVGVNPETGKQQTVVCGASSRDFSNASAGILCTAELAREVNNARSQAYIGNINDPRFKSG